MLASLKFLLSKAKDFFHTRKSASREATWSLVDQIFRDESIEKQVGKSVVFSVNSMGQIFKRSLT